ncbi:hypothetical protein FVE85_6510 [Porphyridium purpureum]|uniref:Cyclin-D1-binding protein 1-like N-terminal domain-containing protein n=1 Tax=Porphyridium purpureum TaxID=35688 RepID=A0A5J4Z6H0_PORPP|nr:hypothetical protein FVE85_6510 [Porphyridium purpureum]|eukprot:POR8701..scf295_1
MGVDSTASIESLALQCTRNVALFEATLADALAAPRGAELSEVQVLSLSTQFRAQLDALKRCLSRIRLVFEEPGRKGGTRAGSGSKDASVKVFQVSVKDAAAAFDELQRMTWSVCETFRQMATQRLASELFVKNFWREIKQLLENVRENIFGVSSINASSEQLNAKLGEAWQTIDNLAQLKTSNRAAIASSFKLSLVCLKDTLTELEESFGDMDQQLQDLRDHWPFEENSEKYPNVLAFREEAYPLCRLGTDMVKVLFRSFLSDQPASEVESVHDVIQLWDALASASQNLQYAVEDLASWSFEERMRDDDILDQLGQGEQLARLLVSQRYELDAENRCPELLPFAEVLAWMQDIENLVQSVPTGNTVDAARVTELRTQYESRACKIILAAYGGGNLPEKFQSLS